MQGRGGDGNEAQREQRQLTVKAVAMVAAKSVAKAAAKSVAKVAASGGVRRNEGGTGFLLVAEVELVLLGWFCWGRERWCQWYGAMSMARELTWAM